MDGPALLTPQSFGTILANSALLIGVAAELEAIRPGAIGRITGKADQMLAEWLAADDPTLEHAKRHLAALPIQASPR